MESAIRNREYAKQLIDFKGLHFGTLMPTDIDAFIDFGDSKFVFIEVKHGDSLLPYGQRVALERLADACIVAGKKTIVIVASHDSVGDIDIANLPVREVRIHKAWHPIEAHLTVRDAIEQWLIRGRYI